MVSDNLHTRQVRISLPILFHRFYPKMRGSTYLRKWRMVIAKVNRFHDDLKNRNEIKLNVFYIKLLHF